MNIKAWQYYSAFYKDSAAKLAVVLIASIGQAVMNLAILLLVRYSFDKVIAAGQFIFLAAIGAAMIALYVLNGAAALWIRHAVLQVTKSTIQQFRDEILKRFYAYPRYHDSAIDRSRLHAIVVQDTERLDIMSNALVAQLIPTVLICIAVSAVLLYFNWFLFLLVIVFVPILFVISRLVGKIVKTRIHAFHRSFENFSKGMKFVLDTVDLAKIQTAEHHEISRQRKNIEELRFASASMAWLSYAYTVIQNTVVASSGIVVLVAGGILIAKKDMTLGQFLSFYTAIGLLRGYLQTIFTCIPQIMEGSESLKTLYDWFEKKDPSPYSGTKRIALAGEIVFSGVQFGFKDRPVLENVDLKIEPGSTVAIVGPSGAGKSTIVNLILGFYRSQGGEISVDGHPLRELDLVNMRRFIRVVRQDPVIFSGTVFDNITYGCPDVDLKYVIEAARLATAHEFIEQLEDGYDTHVGEGGMLLSGGQRQRIAITRALLGKPRVLILDEPTNHLDQDLVSRLMGNIGKMDNISVKLIISHDMNVVSQAQHVYLLENGRIVSDSRPKAVLKNV